MSEAIETPSRDTWEALQARLAERDRQREARAAERGRGRERPAMLPTDPPRQGVQSRRGSAGDTVAPPQPASRQAAPVSHWGPPLWAELHRRPLAFAGNVAAELIWLARFARRIPNGCSCRCRDHWLERVARTPPDLTDALSLARWQWSMHNEVNAAIGKPPLAWEAACELWGWMPPEGIAGRKRPVEMVPAP